MKHILTTITEALQDITQLKYIDRNWGQLDDYGSYPPAQWPAALVDIAEVRYSQGLRGTQLANATVEVTLAWQRMNNTSAQVASATKQEVYDMMDLIDEVQQTLHGYGTSDMQPLQRQYVRKVAVRKGMEIYSIGFATAWTVTPDTLTTTVQNPVVVITTQ